MRANELLRALTEANIPGDTPIASRRGLSTAPIGHLATSTIALMEGGSPCVIASEDDLMHAVPASTLIGTLEAMPGAAPVLLGYDSGSGDYGQLCCDIAGALLNGRQEVILVGVSESEGSDLGRALPLEGAGCRILLSAE